MRSIRERMGRLLGTSRQTESGMSGQTDGATGGQMDSGTGVQMNAKTGRHTDSVALVAHGMKTAGEAGEYAGKAWAALQTALVRNAHGEFLLRQTEYPLHHAHGVHQLGELRQAAPALAALVPLPETTDDGTGCIAPAASSLLFLDIETTGLGAGTGNVPFMVGLAYLKGEQFKVEQAFIRTPAEERAMLAYLQQQLSSFSCLVTYNGKTFDWPVLTGRFILNGLGRLQHKLEHIDFLHPSRSIWRNSLTSCRLSHVEEERLGFHRIDDVPGSEAPRIYFQYLADENPAPLAAVFRHNAEDMLTLAALAIRFGYLLGGELGHKVALPQGPEELLRTGLWLERMQRRELAVPLWEKLASIDAIHPSWSLPFAARDKKSGNWERAVVLWQKTAIACERSRLPVCEAHVELAMYYEHRARNLSLALAYAEAALLLVQQRQQVSSAYQSRQAIANTATASAALRKRITRLRGKLGRGGEPYGNAYTTATSTPTTSKSSTSATGGAAN